MLNSSILIGRLTADPEIRQTSGGVPYCRFTIAVDRPWQKDKDTQADFFQIQAWRHTAEFIYRNFTKGKMIAVQGALRTYEYTDKEDGKKRYGIQLIVNEAHFADSSKKQAEAAEVVPSPEQDRNEFEQMMDNDEYPL